LSGFVAGAVLGGVIGAALGASERMCSLTCPTFNGLRHIALQQSIFSLATRQQFKCS
jgi:ABC-type nitrate/sulfonate/bicarbonate transport system permease component